MRTVFFDVDSQIDFLLPAGALAVPGAVAILPNLATLTRFAGSHSIPVISTVDAHSENDPEFQTWKPHCVVDTVGQQKVAETLLPKTLTLSSNDGAFAEIAEAVASSPQIVVEKQKLDAFTNPNLLPLLQLLQADRYVVYGVVTELCVQCAIEGLRNTGVRTEVVTNAVRSLTVDAERQALERFTAQGAILTTTQAVVSA